MKKRDGGREQGVALKLRFCHKGSAKWGKLWKEAGMHGDKLKI